MADMAQRRGADVHALPDNQTSEEAFCPAFIAAVIRLARE